MGALALMTVPMSGRVASLTTPQGKGGQVIAKPTPTPTPKKTTTTKRNVPSRVTNNSKTDQTSQSASEAASAAEMTFWNSIKDSTNAEDFRTYLKRYPTGQFAELANNRIRALEPAKSPSPAAILAPTPTPEPTYEWTKVERDLPAPVRVEWEGKELSYAVPSGWIRTVREESTKEGKVYYRQISFRAPDSPQTTVTIQINKDYFPQTCKDGRIVAWASAQDFITRRREVYASQNISARLTEPETIAHLTGHWSTFAADVQDVRTLAGLVPALDAVYPDDVWDKSGFFGTVKPAAIEPFNRTRHMYAVREVDLAIVVMLYTAPIDKFDEKLLPSIIGTLKMSGGKFHIYPVWTDRAVTVSKNDVEILIDGERKAWDDSQTVYQLSVGKHHVTVRAKEHKPFEEDIVIGGWHDSSVSAKLEPIASSPSGAKPN